MSNRRVNAKRDANEPEIIEALQWAGCLVQRLNDADVPDLLVCVPHWTDGAATLALIEVKAEHGRLTPGQTAWHELWQTAPVFVAYTPAEALTAVDGLRGTAQHNRRGIQRDPRYIRARTPAWMR